MATVGDIIRLARLEHPSFTEQTISSPLALRLFDQAQSQLALLISQSNPHFLAIPWWIHLRPGESTEMLGAGTQYGFPVQSRQSSLLRSDLPADALVVLDPNATVLEPDFVATSADASSVTCTTLGATTNEFTGKILACLNGYAQDQYREITGNTATVLSVSPNFDPAPDAGDIFMILEPTWIAAPNHTVIQGTTLNQPERAFYVRVLGDGTVTVDVTTPLEATLDTGAPLPPNYAITAAWAYGDTGTGVQWRTSVFLGDRTHQAVSPMPYTIYLAGQKAYLAGGADRWRDVDWIELHYCPVPPASRKMTDTVLLPSEAHEMLITEVACNMGVAAALRKAEGVDPGYFAALRSRGRENMNQLAQNSYLPYLQSIVEVV